MINILSLYLSRTGSLLACAMPLPARALRARRPGTFLHVPCPCLRVDFVFACLRCLFSLLTWVFCRRFHCREYQESAHALMRPTGKVGDSLSDPKPCVLLCPASIYMHLALFYLSVLHDVLLPQSDRPT